jgi:MarR family transcriptional regulator for hemolysin
MTTEPPSLGFLLADTARLLRKRFDQRAREIGLTRAQWQVLAHLARNEGINQAGLAEILEIKPITLSRHLDKMEEAGWIVRRPDANDRRVRILSLSANAKETLEEIRAIGRSLFEEVLEGLPPSRVDDLIDSLQHIRSALSARSHSDPRTVQTTTTEKIRASR